MSRMHYIFSLLLLVSYVPHSISAQTEGDEQETIVIADQDEQPVVDIQTSQDEEAVVEPASPDGTAQEEKKTAEAVVATQDEPAEAGEIDQQDESEVVQALEQIEAKSVPDASDDEVAAQEESASVEEPVTRQQETVEVEDTTTEEAQIPSSPEQEVTQEQPVTQESIPLPPEPVQEPMVEDVDEEPQGIDTVDVNEPEGNWLFKRIWWEKSKELFGKIRDYVDRIVETRMHFFEERVKLDRDRLDPFYISIGMDQGALTEQVNHLLEVLQKEREEDGLLDEHEIAWYTTLTEEKDRLNQLHGAIVDVARIDGLLDDSLRVLMNQINLARSYEREAWQLLNRIADELSDKKAREDYYAIATAWRNVKEVGNYIVGPFSQHFVQLASATVDRLDQIEQAVATLKDKGVELTREVESHDHSDEQHEHEPELEKPVESVGWLSWLWQTVTGWFTW